mmetsp:Transcript_22940/g.65005  ORF Transcript_22940/g.65005 Transcript_22940/m.65005 type:complete len:98 (-) Transcript_22940:110-403(-)
MSQAGNQMDNMDKPEDSRATSQTEEAVPQRVDCMAMPPVHEIMIDADEQEIRECFEHWPPSRVNNLIAEVNAARALRDARQHMVMHDGGAAGGLGDD